jgi:hypothetical protein
MSVLSLPEPSGWQNGHRKLVWPLVGLAIATAWSIFRGAQAALHGHYLTTAVLVCLIAPFWIMFAAHGWVSWGRTTLRVSVDSTGMTLRPDRRLGIFVAVAGAFFIPGAALIVVFVPRGAIDIPMSRGMQIFSPILMACALFTAIAGTITVMKRGGLGYLRVSPSGLENTSPRFAAFVAWDDVVRIEDSAEKRTRKAIVLCRKDGGEEIVEGLHWYVPGGAALYWMIQHYWSHPDDRGELVDGRGLERLSEGRFDVEQTER